MNVYVDAIYPTIMIVCIAPMWAAMIIWFIFFGSPHKEHRDMLSIGCICMVIAFVLVTAWSVFYFSSMYKEKSVMIGYGDDDEPGQY